MNLYKEIRKSYDKKLFDYFRAKWLEMPEDVEDLTKEGELEVIQIQVPGAPQVKINIAPRNEMRQGTHYKRLIVWLEGKMTPNLVHATIARAVALRDEEEAFIELPSADNPDCVLLAKPNIIHVICKVKNRVHIP